MEEIQEIKLVTTFFWLHLQVYEKLQLLNNNVNEGQKSSARFPDQEIVHF